MVIAERHNTINTIIIKVNININLLIKYKSFLKENNKYLIITDKLVYIN